MSVGVVHSFFREIIGDEDHFPPGQRGPLGREEVGHKLGYAFCEEDVILVTSPDTFGEET